MLGILGGGFSGLSIAHLYNGQSEILEADVEVGGHCRTHEIDGFHYDEGGHILFSRDPNVLGQMLDILGENVRQHYRINKIWYKGRFVKYPFENGLGELDLDDTYECLIHYIQDRHPEPTNFKEWIYSTFGTGIADAYLVPYNEKIWKIDLTNVMLDWAGGRVPRPPVEDVVKSALGISTEGYTHQLHFYYPIEGGFQALTDSLAAKVKGKTSIRTGFPVRSVRRDGDEWVVSNGSEERRYDQIVVAMPVQEFLRGLDSVPAEVQAAADGLVYNASLFVFLGLNECMAKEQTSVYFPQPDLIFHRVVFPHSFDDRCAPAGKYAAVAEISCPGEGGAWSMTDAEAVARVTDDLVREGFIKAEDVITSHVTRTQYSYVVYDMAYTKNITTVRDYAASRGINLLGRFAEFEYWNTDQCFESALKLAEKLNGQ